jgi:hypothetical protein
VEIVLLLLAIAPLTLVIYAGKGSIPLNFGSQFIDISSLIIIGVLLFVSISGTYYRPVSAFPLVAYGIALSIVVTTALLLFTKWTSSDGGLRSLGLGVLCATAYSCGLVFLVNGFLTISPPRRIEAKIVSKHQTFGRRDRSYKVRLASGDPAVGDGEWSVSYADYSALIEGSDACVDMHSGFLGAQWYRTGVCPSQPSEPIPWHGFSDWFTYGDGTGSFELYNSASK